jgi:hypothetical protein
VRLGRARLGTDRQGTGLPWYGDEGDADLLMMRLQVEFWTRQRCGRLRGCRRVDRVPEGRSVVSGST